MSPYWTHARSLVAIKVTRWRTRRLLLVICELELMPREDLGRWNPFRQLDPCALRPSAGDGNASSAKAGISTMTAHTVGQPNPRSYQICPSTNRRTRVESRHPATDCGLYTDIPAMEDRQAQPSCDSPRSELDVNLHLPAWGYPWTNDLIAHS